MKPSCLHNLFSMCPGRGVVSRLKARQTNAANISLPSRPKASGPLVLSDLHASGDVAPKISPRLQAQQFTTLQNMINVSGFLLNTLRIYEE